jgi:hypothetical protein
MHKVRGNYSSCTGKSNENRSKQSINSSGSAHEKKERDGGGGVKQDETQFTTEKKGCISEFHPCQKLKVNVLFFLQVLFLNLIRFWTKTQGSSAVFSS